jgi:Essential protein Yae1, N terminal
MGAMICPRCGTPLWTVADGIVYVRCGHRPASVVKPPARDLVQAYERLTYREGWTRGVANGRQSGFDEGFRAGFEAGGEAGAVGVVLTLEKVLQEQLPDLLPQSPLAADHGFGRRAVR